MALGLLAPSRQPRPEGFHSSLFNNNQQCYHHALLRVDWGFLGHGLRNLNFCAIVLCWRRAQELRRAGVVVRGAGRCLNDGCQLEIQGLSWPCLLLPPLHLHLRSTPNNTITNLSLAAGRSSNLSLFPPSRYLGPRPPSETLSLSQSLHHEAHPLAALRSASHQLIYRSCWSGSICGPAEPVIF